MDSNKKYNGTGLFISIAVVLTTTFLIFAKPWQAESTAFTHESNTLAYQTGKAFEAIEVENSANDLSGKTPEKLMIEAEQIKLSAS